MVQFLYLPEHLSTPRKAPLRFLVKAREGQGEMRRVKRAAGILAFDLRDSCNSEVSNPVDCGRDDGPRMPEPNTPPPPLRFGDQRLVRFLPGHQPGYSLGK